MAINSKIQIGESQNPTKSLATYQVAEEAPPPNRWQLPLLMFNYMNW
jgi:hypothetical protein